MRLAEYLGTRTGAAPIEYVKYQLRTMYNIPPSVLAEQTGEHLFEMLQDLKCASWEQKVSRFRKSLGGY